MDLSCWLATPGQFFNAQPMDPAGKKLASSSREVGVSLQRDTTGTGWEIPVKVGGVVALTLRDQTGLPFDFAGQASFMAMPTEDIIVVRYVGTQLQIGDMIKLMVVNLTGTTPTVFHVDLGTMPLIYDISHQLVVQPSPDSRLLFAYIRAGNTAYDSWRTEWHRVLCVAEGDVICQFAEHRISTPIVQAVAYEKIARVTPDRFVEMQYFPGQEPDNIFARCPLPAAPADVQPVRILRVEFNPPGPDIDKERAVIGNAGTQGVAMGGWTLRDKQRHVYTFPAGFTLAAGAEVSVWTKAGTDSATDLFMGYAKAIWNNSNAGDQAELRDAAGRTISIFRYSRPTSSASVGGGIGGGGGTTSQPVVIDEFYVRVDARDPVIETEVPFGIDDVLRIRAQGEVYAGNIFAGAWGPDGAWNLTSDSGFPLNGTDDSHPYALVGKLGTNDPVRFIGTAATLRPNPSTFASVGVRRLYLGVNDNVLGDNNGAFLVTVQKTARVSQPSRTRQQIADQSFFLADGAADLDTGIELRQGDQFRITASGRYTPGGIVGGGETGPDGWDELAVRSGRFPLGVGPDARKFALVFRYAGMPFYRLAGSDITDVYRPQPGANLLLRINDDTTGGESGGYSVRVRVFRPV